MFHSIEDLPADVATVRCDCCTHRQSQRGPPAIQCPEEPGERRGVVFVARVSKCQKRDALVLRHQQTQSEKTQGATTLGVATLEQPAACRCSRVTVEVRRVEGERLQPEAFTLDESLYYRRVDFLYLSCRQVSQGVAGPPIVQSRLRQRGSSSDRADPW